jgi:hypothetical protein
MLLWAPVIIRDSFVTESFTLMGVLSKMSKCSTEQTSKMQFCVIQPEAGINAQPQIEF